MDFELPVLPPHHHLEPCSCTPTVAYIRVSSTRGKNRIVSPDIQLEEIMRDARVNNRMIIKLVFDINKSGTSFKGRALDKVLAEITAEHYFHISVWKWSRWGRNTLESLQMIQAVDVAGGYVHSATEAFDQTTPTGEMIRDTLLVQASWQSRLIGEGWRGTHQQRRAAQRPHSGRERIGYLYEGGRYVLDPDEAPLLRDAYVRYAKGTSLKQLVREWNAAGIPTGAGGIWTPQAFGKMLDTGFAAGLIRERSKPGKDKRTGKNPCNKITDYDIWRTGDHPPIISEEMWQAYRAHRESQASLPPRSRTAVHALSSMLFCGLCGRRMNTKYMGVRQVHNWVCSFRAAYHPETAMSISDAIALTATRDWVRRLLGEDENAAARPGEVDAAGLVLDEIHGRVRAATDQLLAQIAQIAGKRDRTRELYLDRIDPGFTKAKYQARLAEYDSEEQELRVQLLRAKAAAEGSTRASLRPAFVSLDEHWNDFTPADHRAALQTVIGMIRIAPRTTNRISESAQRVEVVPAWEMVEWGDAWLSERRRWQDSQ